jgi:hypothetical protein
MSKAFLTGVVFAIVWALGATAMIALDGAKLERNFANNDNHRAIAANTQNYNEASLASGGNATR